MVLLNENELVEIDDGSTTDRKIIYRPFVWSDDDDDERLSDDKLAALMAKVDAMRANDPPYEIDREQAIQDSIEAYSQIPMFDYGTGKMSNQQAMADFYGRTIVNQILDEIEYSYNHKLDDQKPGHISKKLWQRIKDIRAGRLPKAEPIKYKNQCKPKPEQSESGSIKESIPTESKPKKKKSLRLRS